MRRAKLREVHALLERRGFLAMLAARLMPRVPAASLHYVAGVAPVGVLAFAAAMVLGALVRTAPYAVLGQGIGWGSLATILIAGASIAVGAVTAALLVRRLRTPLPPPELRLSLPEIEGGGRAVARPPPQPGELCYIAVGGSWMIRPNFAGSASESSRGTKRYSAPAGSSVIRSRASSPRTVRPCGTFFGSAA